MGQQAEDRQINVESLDHAYSLVPYSYDWVLKRLEGVERRIEGLMGLGLSVTLSLPVAARVVSRGQLSLHEYLIWHVAVIAVLFLAGTGLGIYARQLRRVSLPAPSALHDTYIFKDEVSFKKDILRYAGKHYKNNARLLRDKSTYADMMSILYGLELLFGVWWVLIL